MESLDLLQAKLTSRPREAVFIVPNLAVALLILLASVVAAVFAHRMARLLLSGVLRNVPPARFLASLVRLSLITLGFIVALNVPQLDRAVLSVLTGVGILGIALGFAFQDMAGNLISGIALVLRDDKPFKVGDVVETNEYLGMRPEDAVGLFRATRPHPGLSCQATVPSRCPM